MGRGLIALAFAAFLSLPAPSALAHDWFTGQTNPVTKWSCCYGFDNTAVPESARDCTPLEIDDWSEDGAEYVFVWPKDGKTYRIPRAQALPSQDRKGRAAACVLNGAARCFFIPLSG